MPRGTTGHFGNKTSYLGPLFPQSMATVGVILRMRATTIELTRQVWLALPFLTSCAHWLEVTLPGRILSASINAECRGPLLIYSHPAITVCLWLVTARSSTTDEPFVLSTFNMKLRDTARVLPVGPRPSQNMGRTVSDLKIVVY